MRRIVFAMVALSLASAASAGVAAADDYDLTWLGLGGADFIKDDGTVYAESFQIADNDLVLGRNRIFYGTANNYGDAWWVSDGTTTTRVGLFDTDHTRSTDNQQKTYVLGFYGGGQFAAGESAARFPTRPGCMTVRRPSRWV